MPVRSLRILFICALSCWGALSAPAANTVVATVAVGGNPLSIVANPKKPYVYVATQATAIPVIDTATNQVTSYLNANGVVLGLAISADGKTLYATTNNPDLEEISTSENQVLATYTVESKPGVPAVSPDGTMIYVPCLYDTVTAIVSGQVTNIAVSGQLTQVAFTPDGDYALVTTLNNSVGVIDTATQSVASISLSGPSNGLAVSADSKTAYVTSQDAVYEVSLSTDSVIATIPVLSSTFNSLGIPAFTPTGTRLYVPVDLGAEGAPAQQVVTVNPKTNKVVGSPITVGVAPIQLAFAKIYRAPYAYVANNGAGTVTVIQIQ
jgi:DNA-binding beta-propeller fold protein YncE